MTTPDPKDLAKIAEALPLKQAYTDLLQPAAREIGKDLETVAQAVTAALAPLRGLVWGMNQIEQWLVGALAERLRGKEGAISTPDPLIAGPTLEALRFAASNEELREMYANLLATSMDGDTAETAHPSFVETLKQLSPDEARILRFLAQPGVGTLPLITLRARDVEEGERGWSEPLRHFSEVGEKAGCLSPKLTPNYLLNLARLGLVQIRDDRYVIPGSGAGPDAAYAPLETHLTIVAAKDLVVAQGKKPEIQREAMILTDLGLQFIRACVQGTPAAAL